MVEGTRLNESGPLRGKRRESRKRDGMGMEAVTVTAKE